MKEHGALASVLRARGATLPQGDDAALEARLTEIVAEAARAWPGVRVEPARFMGYLAARLAPDAGILPALAALHTSDLYLACACVEDPRALAALDAAFFGDCDAALARMAQSPDFADEVKQRARTKLFVREGERAPRIGEYSGRGELRAFLRVVIMREAIGRKRAERRDPPVEGDEGDAAPIVWEARDPELVHLRRTYAAEFERAFRDAVVGLTSEERNTLRYHYVDRLNIDHIGAIYGIHRVSAARRLTRLRATLVEATRLKLAERLHLSGSELRSALRLIESEVDVSLRAALIEPSIGP